MNKNFLMFGLFALAFYWIYLNGKATKHEATATAAAKPANTTAAEAAPAAKQPVKSVAVKPRFVPINPRYAGVTQIATPAPVSDFTIVAAKTPFIYEN